MLTEAGRALIEPARAAVRSLEVALASVESVHELREGRLDLAAMPSQALEPLTAAELGLLTSAGTVAGREVSASVLGLL